MTTRLSLPPLRYFAGCVLIAATSVFLEKASHISSGGISGLSIGIADTFHLSLGVVNLSLKAAIFSVVFIFGGKSTALWTIFASVMTATFMWVFEQLPVDIDWPKGLAFILILLFAKLPIGLLVSRGYSSGGFVAISQLLEHRKQIPLWASLLLFNILSILAMYSAHGTLSGIATAVIALSSGVATQTWANVTCRLLDRRSLLNE